MVQGLGKKFIRPHLSPWLGVVVHACCPSYVGCVIRRVMVQAQTLRLY
jgi:hypothetical protein